MSPALFRCIAGAAILWLLWSNDAQAAAPVPASVRIVVAPCEAILKTTELVERLRGELLAVGVEHLEWLDPGSAPPADAGREHAASLHVYFPECASDHGVVNLRISDRLTLKYVERALFVGDMSREARPRTLALAIAELLRATWLELLLTKPSVSEPGESLRETMIATLQERLPTPASTEGDSAQREEDDPYAARWFRPRLEWIAGSRFYPQASSGDLSSAISASLALNRHLRVHTGAIVAGGGTSGGRDVHLFEAAGRIGVGITGGNEYEVELASVFEIGWAQLRGPAIRDAGGAMVIGALHATVRTKVARGVDVLWGLQAGYVLTPLTRSPSHRALLDAADVPEYLVEAAHTLGAAPNGLSGPLVGVLLGLSGIL